MKIPKSFTLKDFTLTDAASGSFTLTEAELGDPLLGVMPNGDYAIVQMDAEARVYIAKEHVEALRRIEGKLDDVLRWLARGRNDEQTRDQ